MLSTVAPALSREKYARIPARSPNGKTKAPKMRARFCTSDCRIRPNCKPLCKTDPIPKAKKPSGSGLAIGLKTILVRSSVRGCESFSANMSPVFPHSPRGTAHYMLKAHSTIEISIVRKGFMPSVKIVFV